MVDEVPSGVLSYLHSVLCFILGNPTERRARRPYACIFSYLCSSMYCFSSRHRSSVIEIDYYRILYLDPIASFWESWPQIDATCFRTRLTLKSGFVDGGLRMIPLKYLICVCWECSISHSVRSRLSASSKWNCMLKHKIDICVRVVTVCAVAVIHSSSSQPATASWARSSSGSNHS